MKERNPFLWKLQSNTDSDSYLFGTMHISEGKDVDKLRLVKDKIDECNYFATEMDLGQRSLMDTNSFHLDTSLSTKMNANHYKRCRKILLRSFDVDLNVIGILKPLIITNMIAEVVLGKTGCIGLDQYLYNYAAEAEKNLVFVSKGTSNESSTMVGPLYPSSPNRFPPITMSHPPNCLLWRKRTFVC